MINQNSSLNKSNELRKRKNNLIINTNINSSLNNNITKVENNSSIDNSKPTFSFLPKITREKILGSPKELKVGYGLFEKLKRKETKKILSIRDQKIAEANKLYKITNEIENFMGKENIGQKVDKYIDDYKLQKYLNQFRDNQNENILKKRDYYKQQKEKINEMLGELFIKNIQKKSREREKYYNDRLRRDKYDYFFKIENELKKSLKEFDNNVILNQINLNINELNNVSSEDLRRQSIDT